MTTSPPCGGGEREPSDWAMGRAMRFILSEPQFQPPYLMSNETHAKAIAFLLDEARDLGAPPAPSATKELDDA